MRSRRDKQFATLGRIYATNGTNPPIVDYVSRHDQDLLLGDRGHYGYPRMGAKNVGGAFLTNGVTVLRNPSESIVAWRGGSFKEHYDGSFIANLGGQAMWTMNQGIPELNLDSLGATAYNRMKPTKPVFSGLNAIYELREVPEMLRQRMSGNGLKDIGSYFLAEQFGWAPLLSDIRATVDFQRKAQKKLAWLLKHNNKPVRTRIGISDAGYVKEPTITDNVAYNALSPVHTTQYYAEVPRSRTKFEDSVRYWATARFRYWLPGGPRDIVWKASMLAALYGLNPTPKVIWNAMPWSWLIDWFSNAGDVIANLDAGVADRLASDYIYVMQYRMNKWTMESSCHFNQQDGSKKLVTAQSTAETYVKQRVMGSPFGFGISQSSLSGMQLAILGALGVSRL